MILKIIHRNRPIQSTIEVVNLKNFDTIMMGLGGEGDVAFINSTSAQYIYLTSPSGLEYFKDHVETIWSTQLSDSNAVINVKVDEIIHGCNFNTAITTKGFKLYDLFRS